MNRRLNYQLSSGHPPRIERARQARLERPCVSVARTPAAVARTPSPAAFALALGVARASKKLY